MFTAIVLAASLGGAPERPAVRFTVKAMEPWPAVAAPVVRTSYAPAVGPRQAPFAGFYGPGAILTGTTDSGIRPAVLLTLADSPAEKKPDDAAEKTGEEKKEDEPAKPETKYFAEKLLEGTRAGCFLESRGIKVFGWTAANFTGSSASVSNLPVTFNDFANAGQMNQNWLEVSKAIDTEKKERQWGFRYATILPGTDARFTIARGLGDPFNGDYPIDPMVYGYAELFLPCWGREGTTLRVGKWGTGIGFEQIDAVNTPFVSKSYNFQFNPFTHTGVQATTGLNEAWSVYYGIVTGADIFLDPAGTATFVGGLKRTPKDGRNTVALNVMVNNADYNSTVRFINHDCFNLLVTHKFNDRLSYTLDSTYSFMHNVPNIGNVNWYGFANFLSYQHCNEKLTSTLRAEIFEDSQGFRTGTEGTYFEAIYGVAYKPKDWALVRPFVRYDYNRNGPWEGKDNLWTGGIELIVRW